MKHDVNISVNFKIAVIYLKLIAIYLLSRPFHNVDICMNRDICYEP